MIYIMVLLVFQANLVAAGNAGVTTPETEPLLQSAEQEYYKMGNATFSCATPSQPASVLI